MGPCYNKGILTSASAGGTDAPRRFLTAELQGVNFYHNNSTTGWRWVFFEEEELNALLGDLSQHAATLKDISRMRK